MSVYLEMVLACDVPGCDNESVVVTDHAYTPQEGFHAYMRERGAEPPRAWRVVGDRDVCYRHPDLHA